MSTPAAACSHVVLVAATAMSPRMIDTTTAVMCGAKNHQCGCRSRTTSSPSFSSFLGNGTAAAYPCRTGSRGHADPADARASVPPELGEAAVVDARVLGDPVHY